ncbi:putative immunoglobulin domain protein, partial [Trichinella spiralis]|uniref:putative immunoglobulin domain protein n=1 Tax=Trichinella spiralis TaxID=6334 RepID=UPI0001EFB88F
KVDDNDEESEEMKEKTKKSSVEMNYSNLSNFMHFLIGYFLQDICRRCRIVRMKRRQLQWTAARKKRMQSPRKKNTLRRDIRGIMKMKDLKKSTVKAHRDEMARRKRIEMLQKKVLAFLHTVMKDVDFNVNRVLIVTPINVVLNWRNEISLWLDDHGFDKNIWAMHEVRTTKDRYYVIERWENDGGILIIGYELLRYLLTCTRKGNRAMIEKAFSKPDYAMVNFVKPNLLGTRMEFLNRFVNPIKNGQMSDSTLGDVALMKRRVHILHNLLCGFVHRVDYRAISEALPPKFEYVLFVRLSNVQRKLYTDYLGTFYDESRNVKDKSVLQSALFVHYQVLQRVCSHPRELFIMEERAQKKVQLKRLPVSNGANGNKVMENKLNEYESEQSLSSSLSTNSCELTDEEPANREQSVAKDLPKPIEPPPVSKKNWYLPTLKEDDPLLVEMSGKMVVLFEIIQRCGDIGDKVLIFSQSLITLDLIEELLRLQERNVGESSSREFNYWVPGIDYIRMDGSTNASTRERLAKKFNDETNRRCRVFLLSTKAGSLGINLIGANRVVVFDANWNPSHDLQAMFRVYRLGQCKPVYIYRLIAKGTMEETIYQRQVVKQSLSCRVIDEQQIGRHFTFSDLEYLYHFDPDEDDKHRTETPVLPKDRLLADLLCDISQWIIRYIEHDSLLKNIVEEKLTEEELKSAWREYEDERKREKDAKEQLELQQQMNYNVPPPLFSHSTPTLLARLTGNYELAQHVRLPRPHSMTSSSTSPDLMMGTDRLFPEMREKMPDLTFTSRAKFGNPPVNSSEINTLVTPEIRSKLLRIANRTGKSMQNWLKQISLEYPQATTNRVALQNVVDDLYRQHGQPRL